MKVSLSQFSASLLIGAACLACMSHPQAATQDAKPASVAAAPSPTPLPRSPNAAPKWVKDLYKKSKSNPTEHTKFDASEWKFKGHTVYLLSAAQCCDIPNELYTAEGKKVCMIGGGFAGATDPQCSDFNDTAKLIGSLDLN